MAQIPCSSSEMLAFLEGFGRDGVIETSDGDVFEFTGVTTLGGFVSALRFINCSAEQEPRFRRELGQQGIRVKEIESGHNGEAGSDGTAEEASAETEGAETEDTSEAP